MEKYSKKLIVFIFTLIFLVIGLGTYIYVDKFVLTDDKECVCDCDNKSIIKDNSKPIVYDNVKYNYLKIAYINIDSIDADKANTEIEEFFTKTHKLTDIEDTTGFITKYNYFSNSNILSIISLYHPAAVNFFKAVNINIKTGKMVDNSDLILTSGINKDEINDIMVKIFEDSIDQENESYYKATTLPGETENVYDKNVNNFKDMKVDNLEMYLNNNGELCVIVEEYQIAGSETNRRIMNINKKAYEKFE